jgi:hypothetical protein
MANWAASKKRVLMHRRGAEHSRDDSASIIRRVVPEHSTTVRRPRVSKADLRAQAEAAVAQFGVGNKPSADASALSADRPDDFATKPRADAAAFIAWKAARAAER